MTDKVSSSRTPPTRRGSTGTCGRPASSGWCSRKSACGEALGGRGKVLETARDYRRAGDERLFRLGEQRYAALMDTLIQPASRSSPRSATAVLLLQDLEEGIATTPRSGIRSAWPAPGSAA